MTRKEQITDANPYGDSSEIAYGKRIGFVIGAEWADAHPKNPWISVEECLPPDMHKNVLLKIKNCGVIIGLGLNIKDKSLDITHWMPIPELNA